MSQAYDVLLEQTDGLADQQVVYFLDISDTELSATSQAFEDSCVRQSTANLGHKSTAACAYKRVSEN